eukprot:COSAG06_NODE_20333_length_799_cov_1.360000_2_plen_105_part_01
MGATNNSQQDAAAGRVPREASRPMTSSRAGFVEAQGAGMQILMDAKLAIQMGVPIYGIVGLTNTATVRKRHFFEFFLMFVPSLSWQNDRFLYKWLKNGVVPLLYP